MWWLSGWPLTPSRAFSPSPPETMTWTQTGVLTPPHDPPAQDDCKAHGPCPVANTDTKLLIHGLFQKGRVLAQDGNQLRNHAAMVPADWRPIKFGAHG